MGKKTIPTGWIYQTLGVLIISTVLSGCSEPKTESLSFETIAQEQSLGDIVCCDEGEPELLVIASRREIAQQLSEDLKEKLRAVDYAQYFVLLVLEGQKAITTSEIITVQSVVRRDSEVFVQAEFPGYPIGQPVMMAFSNPYHLIAVAKEGSWGKRIKFGLKNGEEQVAEATRFIP